VSAPDLGAPVRTELEADGAILRIVFGTPPANILDASTIGALDAVLQALPGTGPELRLVTIEGEGDNFSYGASVEEHLPGDVERMLPSFHSLLRRVLQLRVPTAALLRGRCLGGGLELAACCDVLLAASGARMGQPEVVLGVFAPAASAVLPQRIAPAVACDLLLTGRTIDAARAHAIGLVSQVFPASSFDDDFAAWAKRYILPRSATALRFAIKAARLGTTEAILANLDRVEELYLSELMTCQDPTEGLTAFTEKRPPRWTHA